MCMCIIVYIYINYIYVSIFFHHILSTSLPVVSSRSMASMVTSGLVMTDVGFVSYKKETDD
jgi:hypothetical protein